MLVSKFKERNTVNKVNDDNKLSLDVFTWLVKADRRHARRVERGWRVSLIQRNVYLVD